jgi:hypothetical protein
MKTFILAAVLFLVGSALGLEVSPIMMRWFGSVWGVKMVSLYPSECTLTFIRFSIGCGVLFGISPILAAWAHPKSGWLVRTLPYLLVGCAISFTVALYHRWLFSSLALNELSTDHPTLISVDAIPTLRLPLIGIISMIVIAVLAKALAGKHPRKQHT